VVAASQAHGQASPAPCPAGVVAQPTFTAWDLDENKSHAVRHHTIEVLTSFDAPPPCAARRGQRERVGAGHDRGAHSGPGTTVEPTRGSRGGDLNPGPGGADVLLRHIRPPPPLGYDIELTQAGRLRARFRLAGRCTTFSCNMRTVRVQR
jgi:hypothetical protein